MGSLPSDSRLLPVMVVVLAVTLAACGQHPAGVGLATGVPVPPTSTAMPAVRDAGQAASTAPQPAALKVELVWSTQGRPLSPGRPIALTRTAQGNLIVLDASTHRAMVFDGAGNLVRLWGGKGSDAGQFRFAQPDCEDDRLPDPCPGAGGVAVDASGQVYVADSGNHRIQVFDRDGQFLGSWGRAGTGAGEFRLPSGIAVDRQGHVYVSDTGNRRIQTFDRSGHFLTEWGGFDMDSGLFIAPGALAVDEQGRVSVVDLWTNHVQQFDEQGRFLRQWTTAGLVGAIATGSAIAADGQGNLYVTGTTGRVLKLSEQGAVLSSWGGGGSWDVSLRRPSGLAVEEDGSIYIADQEAGCLLKLRQLLPVVSYRTSDSWSLEDREGIVHPERATNPSAGGRSRWRV